MSTASNRGSMLGGWCDKHGGYTGLRCSLCLHPWLEDADVTLYHGDVLTTLRELSAESVDCVVTSPPYWGLRDYGDERQLGLEPTPDEYVQRMVAVFREVRRVLAAHGTVWLNLGDSYAGNNGTGEKQRNSPSYQARVQSPGMHGAFNYTKTDDVQQTSGQRKNPAGYRPKDLIGIPWRVAFALQADGWYLRSDIIWAKPNPMPESVTDRPTKAHEYVFLLSKQPRYFFDQEAVREAWSESTVRIHGSSGVQRRAGEWKSEHVGQGHSGLGNGPSRFGSESVSRPRPRFPLFESGDPDVGECLRGPDGRRKTTVQGADGSIQHRDGERWPNGGRNIRSVWEIATQPYPEAHFATFPEELARRCIAAGCPEQVCRVCGKARERITKRTEPSMWEQRKAHDYSGRKDGPNDNYKSVSRGRPENSGVGYAQLETLGFTECDCVTGPRKTLWPDFQKYRPGSVLDPFMGSGTVAFVARKLGRHAVGIDLSAEYLELAARRLQQQSLFAEAL